MDSLKEFLGFALMMLLASLNWIILLLLIAGIVKVWEWRKDYLGLVSRVTQLEAQQANGATPQRDN